MCACFPVTIWGWGPAPLPNCPITSQNIPYTSTNVIRVLDNGVWRDPLVGDIVKPVGWDSCTHSCCNGGNSPECNLIKFKVTALIQTNYDGPIYDPWELTDCTPNCQGTNPCDPSNFTNAFSQHPTLEVDGGQNIGCRACGLLPQMSGLFSGAIGGGISPSTPSSNPNFATYGDVCTYLDTNNCC